LEDRIENGLDANPVEAADVAHDPLELLVAVQVELELADVEGAGGAKLLPMVCASSPRYPGPSRIDARRMRTFCSLIT
jgi:hypothetical protein